MVQAQDSTSRQDKCMLAQMLAWTHICFVLTQIHFYGPTRACTDRRFHRQRSHSTGIWKTTNPGCSQPLPFRSSGGSGLQGRPLLSEAAGAHSSILPSWHLQTLCSSLIPQYSLMSLLHSHWSSTRLQDNKVTNHLNQICTWNCSYLNCSPSWNAIYLDGVKKKIFLNILQVINLLGYQSSRL